MNSKLPGRWLSNKLDKPVVLTAEERIGFSLG